MVSGGITPRILNVGTSGGERSARRRYLLDKRLSGHQNRLGTEPRFNGLQHLTS
jgi:hypothetical protein